MKIVTKDELTKVNPGKECFIIKSVFDRQKAQEVMLFLDNFRKTMPENFMHKGNNWHYISTSHNNRFDSFLFNNLNQLDNPLLKEFYKELYSIYNAFGEKTHYNNFETDCGVITDDSIFTINPLVFWYEVGVTRFGWHKHPAENQRFQLVCNLTTPGTDYTGGETIVYMGEGLPDQNQVENCEVFDARLDQGDVLGFPYDKWHKVNGVNAGNGKNWESRVSLLMPISPRVAKVQNEYLD